MRLGIGLILGLTGADALSCYTCTHRENSYGRTLVSSESNGLNRSEIFRITIGDRLMSKKTIFSEDRKIVLDRLFLTERFRWSKIVRRRIKTVF